MTAYGYTAPYINALTEKFGTPFHLWHTGGGCWCLQADIEGGGYILVGSAVDGPLLTDDERQGQLNGGGFGVGVYGENGCSMADVVDYCAHTPEAVVFDVELALSLLPLRSDTEYAVVTRTVDGKLTYTRRDLCRGSGAGHE